MTLILRKIQYLLLIVLAFNVTNAQQDFQGVATYESKTTIDLDNIGTGRRQLSEAQKKEFAERLRRNLEKTYTLRFNKTESMYKEQAKLQAPTAGGQGRRGFGGFANSFAPGDQYKNVKEAQLLQEQEFFGKQFLIKEGLKKLNWKIEKESKQIGQYLAFKATAIKTVENADFGNFFRRGRAGNTGETTKDSTTTKPQVDKLVKSKEVMVTAWYTPQIPVSQGPGEYWGLPGLILEVNEGRTSILCSKIIINPGEKEVIKAPSKGKEVTKAEYTKIINKKMVEMRENFRSRGGRGGGRRN